MLDRTSTLIRWQASTEWQRRVGSSSPPAVTHLLQLASRSARVVGVCVYSEGPWHHTTPPGRARAQRPPRPGTPCHKPPEGASVGGSDDHPALPRLPAAPQGPARCRPIRASLREVRAKLMSSCLKSSARKLEKIWPLIVSSYLWNIGLVSKRLFPPRKNASTIRRCTLEQA